MDSYSDQSFGICKIVWFEHLEFSGLYKLVIRIRHISIVGIWIQPKSRLGSRSNEALAGHSIYEI